MVTLVACGQYAACTTRFVFAVLVSSYGLSHDNASCCLLIPAILHLFHWQLN